VCAITDTQLAMRDNSDLIGEDRSVPVSEGSPRSRQNPILGRSLTTQPGKIAAKSLVLEDFTRNSFKVKELAGISP
jgi:hypothetical protein